MSHEVRRRESAERDLDEIAFYLAGFDVANGFRFLDAFEETARRIGAVPGIGSPFPVVNPTLEGLRRASVAGFKKYKVFYLADDRAVEIVRVLHGARDIRAILEREA